MSPPHRLRQSFGIFQVVPSGPTSGVKNPLWRWRDGEGSDSVKSVRVHTRRKARFGWRPESIGNLGCRIKPTIFEELQHSDSCKQLDIRRPSRVCISRRGYGLFLPVGPPCLQATMRWSCSPEGAGRRTKQV